MAFDNTSTYSGAIASGDTGTANLMNSLYLQTSSFAELPDPGNAGVASVVTDDTGAGGPNALYRDNGTSWVKIGVLPDTDFGIARFWVSFTATGGINDSYNVSSITDNGKGDWTINFSSAIFANTNYMAVAAVDQPSCSNLTAWCEALENKNTTTIQMLLFSASGTGNGTIVAADAEDMMVTGFGDAV